MVRNQEPPSRAGETPVDRLESWKEIATYIGRDERTAMRWATERGMPVHRVPGGKRSRVFASRAEISSWLSGIRSAVAESTPAPVARRHVSASWIIIGAAAGLAVLGTLAFFLRNRSHLGIPERITFSETA